MPYPTQHGRFRRWIHQIIPEIKWKKIYNKSHHNKTSSFKQASPNIKKKSNPIIYQLNGLFYTLEPYQINILFFVFSLLLLTIIYIFFQMGRIIGLLEVIVYGTNDILRFFLWFL
ncbi:hypothetical protein BJ944DRAFT_269206 [Cunninghamella echinulata]|nr:hypothetical protein BJ944DRAFT_269206 [Cunninghamella echinulata]